MDVTRYQLANGMQVILQPNHAAPVVACNVWVGVGSADETPEEAGLAHVHEHMLFKGTARRGVGQIAREVEAAGGHINAFTSFDQTCYYVAMSSRFFEQGLDILSDAIRNSSFDAEELSNELEVIQEEIKRGKDSPARTASQSMFETAYAAHPYRLPVIGSKESVDSFTREHVVNFFHKHYVPSNMAVVLVGDFELEDARAKINKYFGDFQGPEHARPGRPVEPQQDAVRVKIVHDGKQDTHLRLAFHIPDAMHEDIPALDLLATVMGSGEASHLFQTIHRERELAHSAYAGIYTPKDDGIFVVGADYQVDDEAGVDHVPVLAAVAEEVFRFHHLEISEPDLRRARVMLESQSIYSKQTVEGLAMKLGHYQMVTGDPSFEDAYNARLAAVTLDDLHRVARQYLTLQNLSIVLCHPEDHGASSEDALEAAALKAYDAALASGEHEEALTELIAPPRPEAISAPVDVHVGALDADGFVTVALPNGTTLIVQENHAVETFSVRALNLGGVRYETAADNGVNALLTELLTLGTPTRDAVRLSHEAESMACHLGGISGRNSFGLSMTALTQYAEPCLELFAECLYDATIPADEFERARRVHIQELRSQQDQLGSVNFHNFTSAFFGDHPYALPVSGTEESVSGLTPDAVRAFHRRVVDPSRMALAIVGDVDAAKIAALATQLFGARTSDDALGDVRFDTPAAPASPILTTADLDKNQAHIIVGFRGPTLDSDERYALEVLHAVMSGQGGRLFAELRDKMSLAYSVYASMMLGVELGTFMVNIGTSPEKIDQAIGGIAAEIRRLTTEPPSAQELADAKRYLIGNHDIGLQRNSSRAMSVALDHLYGLDYKRAFAYAEHINAVTPEQIHDLVTRYLVLDQAIVSITKPAEIEVSASLLGEHF